MYYATFHINNDVLLQKFDIINQDYKYETYEYKKTYDSKGNIT